MSILEFLEEQGLSYIVRAHEAHSEGVALSKGARVFTVFSTSKDHGQGQGAMAGCILVDFDQIHVINRSTAYKNKVLSFFEFQPVFQFSKHFTLLSLVIFSLFTEEDPSLWLGYLKGR